MLKLKKSFFICTVIVVSLFVCSCSAKKPQKAVPPKSISHSKSKPYKVMNKWYKPIAHSNAKNFTQKGLASWYGKKFHGRKTANGETYDMHAMTAAHKELPFGTCVKVHNLNNGKKVEVRINDRGPFIRGRIIDLSYKAAKKLDIVKTGTVPVKITVISAKFKSETKNKNNKIILEEYCYGKFTIQLGAFSEYTNALKLKRKLDKLDKEAHISSYSSEEEILHRVRVGNCLTLQKAMEYEKILLQNGFNDAFMIVME